MCRTPPYERWPDRFIFVLVVIGGFDFIWLCLCIKGHSGLGARGRGRVWREHGGVWRQQLQSFGNPPKLPAHLQSPLLIQGVNTHTRSFCFCSYMVTHIHISNVCSYLLNHNAQLLTSKYTGRLVKCQLEMPLFAFNSVFLLWINQHGSFGVNTDY